MPIVQQGTLNTTSLIVPDIYVQIVPPQLLELNGVPTNVLGMVGTASWGPVNAPTTIGSMADYARLFGAMQARRHDLGTAVAAAVLQGANNFRCVRVTDGTDKAAQAVIAAQVVHLPKPPVEKPKPPEEDKPNPPQSPTEPPTDKPKPPEEAPQKPPKHPKPPKETLPDEPNDEDIEQTLAARTCLTFTSRYTGSLGNTIQVTLNAGSQAGTWRIVVSMPGLVPETFDNLAKDLTGKTRWQAFADAINQGQPGLRGPSQFITAQAGEAQDVPSVTRLTLKGGTDGADQVNSHTLLGQDGLLRTGLYALRNTGVSIACLVDADDADTWSAQAAFAQQEGVYLIAVGKLGETINQAIATKQTKGIDSYAFKLMLGDGCYFNDPVNGVRLISPQGFVAGRLANLSPAESSLNKPLFGIVGTQISHENRTYSNAELQQLAEAGIDVITNPIPAGRQFGVRIGHNTSTNAVIQGDNYTRMTHFIAATLDRGMGLFVGRLHSVDERRKVATTLSHFFSNLESQGLIGDANGGAAFSVQIDQRNNPPERVSLGYLQADVKVKYLSIIEKFLINVEGGQSVQVARQSTLNQ